MSDLDGTLLNPKGRLEKQVELRLNQMIDSGLDITFATARNYRSTKEILSGVHLNYPIILQDGLFLADLKNETYLDIDNTIPDSIHSKILPDLISQDAGILIHTFKKQETLFYSKDKNKGFVSYINSLEGIFNLEKIESLQNNKYCRIAGFTLVDSEKKLKPIANALRKKYINQLQIHYSKDVCLPGFGWLQVFHQNAEKGKMAAILAKKIGVVKKNIIAIGNHLNDLSLFKSAGKSIAVSTSHPKILKTADTIIPFNNGHGPIKFLEETFKDKKKFP